DRLLERERSRIRVSRDGRDYTVMADIGAIAPLIQPDGAPFGMGAKLAQQLWPAAALGCRFSQQHDGAVQADRQHVVIGAERFEARSVLDVRAETADAGDNRLARLRMSPELARQCKQPQ